MRVGYVGLGAMGSALAAHLVHKHSLTVLDLNRDAVASFVPNLPARYRVFVARAPACQLLIMPYSATSPSDSRWRAERVSRRGNRVLRLFRVEAWRGYRRLIGVFSFCYVTF